MMKEMIRLDEGKKDFTIDELEEMLEAKRKELGKGIKQTAEQVLPPGKAPSGFVWVYNRGPKDFEWQHDTVVYKIEGHSFGLFPYAIAEHGRRRSLLTVDPITNVSTHQLALPEDSATYGRPVDSVARPYGDVIDRTSDMTKDKIVRIDVAGGEGIVSSSIGSELK